MGKQSTLGLDLNWARRKERMEWVSLVLGGRWGGFSGPG